MIPISTRHQPLSKHNHTNCLNIGVVSGTKSKIKACCIYVYLKKKKLKLPRAASGCVIFHLEFAAHTPGTVLNWHCAFLYSLHSAALSSHTLFFKFKPRHMRCSFSLLKAAVVILISINKRITKWKFNSLKGKA